MEVRFFIRVAESSNRTFNIFSPHLWDEFEQPFQGSTSGDTSEVL